MAKSIQFYEQSKMTLDEAISESVASLKEYGNRYPHWVSTYSGGKDSTATVTLVAWAIDERLVSPETLTILLANTRLELVPLFLSAKVLLSQLEERGHKTRIVEPELDNRAFVSILGRGLPPFNNGRRTCTRMFKGDPMDNAVKKMSNIEKTLFITGVRLGESRSRDNRIAVSCSKDGGECGQGWFQDKFNKDGASSLSPIVHWRTCNVFDWLYFEQDRHKFHVDGVIEVYGDEDIRTGCMACFMVEEDKALNRLIKNPKWAYLEPILELKTVVYPWLSRWENRLRMPVKFTKNGDVHQKSGVVGALTMDARKRGLEMVLDIQQRANYELINDEELSRIYWHWKNNTWPRGWTGNEPLASAFQPRVYPISEGYVTQTVLSDNV